MIKKIRHFEKGVSNKPKIAVLRCSGISRCEYGCLGEGDCVNVCRSNAIKINHVTRLPEVDEDKCIGCGVCAEACPRNLIEIRNRGPQGIRVWVACSNHDKGSVAMTLCKSACIGCGKCMTICRHGAISITDNLASIDCEKCRLCKRCTAVCPTHAINAVNFPTLKLQPIETEQ